MQYRDLLDGLQHHRNGNSGCISCGGDDGDTDGRRCLSVSDNTVTKKSLVSGRTKEEMDYRRYVRKELFPQIIFDIFA